MSMDYLKNVYVPRRDSTRKITSYGYMNHWCDYTEAPSADKQLVNPLTNQKAPLAPGVVLDIPSNRSLTPLTKQILLRRQQMAEKNKRELLQKFGENSGQGVHRLKPLSHSMDVEDYRTENTLPDGSMIIAGRKLIPDPMMTGPTVHLSYSHSGGYDDYHKTFLKLQKDGIYPSYPLYGPPRLRNGGVGGSWKHVKEVMQARGARTLFVDGLPREVENMAMAGGKIPGTDLYYPLKSDNGPIGRKAKGRIITSPPNRMSTHSKEALRQTEAANFSLLR